MNPKTRRISELMKLVESGEARNLPTDQLRSIQAVLRDHRIEQSEIPSASPGVPENPGASPKQIAVQDAFFNGGYRIVAASGANQCLARGTLITTPAGPHKIETLQPGDWVYGPDGRPTRVIHRWDNGKREVHSLRNRGVEWVSATPDHAFLRRKDATREAKVAPLPARNQVRRVEVDCPLGPVQEPGAYALGALLGDGCCRESGLVISSGTSEVPERTARILGGEAEKKQAANCSYDLLVDPPPHYTDWCEGRYAHEKTADLEVLKTWDRESLLAFVAGVIDTDGSVFVDRWDNLVISVGMQAEQVIQALQWAFLALWQTPVVIHRDSRIYTHAPYFYFAVRTNAFSKRILRELDPYLAHPSKKWRVEYEDLESWRSSPDWIHLAEGEEPEEVETHDLLVDHPTHTFLLANGLVSSNSGKTEAIGGLAFCKHLRDSARDGDVYWVISQSSMTMRDIPHKTMWEFLPRSMFPEGVEYSPKLGFGQIPTLQLTLPNGRGTCEVWFKTEEMDLKAFESSRVNGIWWTECKKEAIFFAIQPRMAAKKGFLLMDYVPTEAWHRLRIKEPAESGLDSAIYHTRFGMADNAHNLPAGEIEYQRAQMSEEEAAVRIDGEDAAAFGVVYKQFDPDRHVLEPFPIPPEWPRWRTLDYGYRNPTACLWVTACPPGTLLPDGRILEAGGLIVYRELYRAERTVRQNVDEILAASEGEAFRSPVVIDPTAYNITQANGQSIAQAYRNAGLTVRRGIKVDKYGNKRMVENVRRLLENDQLFVFRTCPNTIFEHRVWRYKETAQGEVPGDEPFEKKNDHTADALKLLVAENPRYAPSVQGDIVDAPEGLEV